MKVKNNKLLNSRDWVTTAPLILIMLIIKIITLTNNMGNANMMSNATKEILILSSSSVLRNYFNKMMEQNCFHICI